MNKQTLAAAKSAAQEFLERIEAYEVAVKAANGQEHQPRESGSVRRQSMELTRSLARLRRS